MLNTSGFREKIINDPVHGFIHVRSALVFKFIEHPWFQRLRRIRQLGLSELVYPGATHTRFHHALGAMHLMSTALDILKSKGVAISQEEHEAACAALLLHDIGHGPFSHTLERSIVQGVSHEDISRMLMHRLDEMHNGALQLARSIFAGTYARPFFHQLISGQLDMDRLDYLMRDSFYTGVSEGVVGADRIIHMLNVVNDELVVEEKGIYSIEKFIIARRLMYWQVYLHKTVIAADNLLWKILLRARELAGSGHTPASTDALTYFLEGGGAEDEMLQRFVELDDTDIQLAVKNWARHSDRVLALLCQSLMNRRLPRIQLRNSAFSNEEIAGKTADVCRILGIEAKDAVYFVQTGELENEAYRSEGGGIQILRKNGKVEDVASASDNYSLQSLKTTVTKYYLSYWRE
ncbi:MAG: HD domain-containing protein [Bacteroidota bacterium]|jgi:HD superfamily phosphohydrolase